MDLETIFRDERHTAVRDTVRSCVERYEEAVSLFHLNGKFKECRSMSGDMGGIFLNVQRFLISLYQLFEVGKSL